MQLSNRYLNKLAQKLFSDQEAERLFIAALCNPKAYPEAILWCQERPGAYPFSLAPRTNWQPEFVDRLEPLQRPGAHELHNQGAYYCLDLSSVFAAQILSAIDLKNPVILDLCAAPGGKSVFAYQQFRPELLICNETIGKRLGALTSNLKRCKIEPVLATNRDPKDLAISLGSSCDLVIVDAPCSGQSLLTKGEEAAGCFHPATINLNKNRQRRIIAEASKLVAPGGYLAYMTCTFSIEENEEIINWLLRKFPEFVTCPVASLSEYQSSLSNEHCYRLWPQSGLGAGSFTALIKRISDSERNEIDLSQIPVSWSQPEGLRKYTQNQNRTSRQKR